MVESNEKLSYRRRRETVRSGVRTKDKRVQAKTTLIASETDSKLFAYSETLGQSILKYVETKI